MQYIRFVVAMAVVFSPIVGLAAEDELKSGVNPSHFDASVKPGDDFYRYVNQKWIDANPIPEEYSRWGAFHKLRDDNVARLRELIEDLEKAAGPLDGNKQKIRDLYRQGMDEAALNRAGAASLADDLAKIDKLSDASHIVALLGEFRATGMGMLFHFGVSQDEKQSDRYAANLHQSGLSLPERGYYLDATDDAKRIRAQYCEHVSKMLILLGETTEQANADAQTVLKIETQLAKASRTPVQLRDAEANYNKKTLAELAAMTPNVNWDAYLKPLPMAGVPYVIVGQPEFFQRVNEMIASTPLADWKVYLRWHVVHSAASCLGDAFDNEDFRFFSGVLRGVKQMPPRWKRVVRTIDGLMGEALGQLYVEKYFPPVAKQRMDELVKNVLAAYRERIETRDWMSADTRKQALAKLATIMPKIGYPDKWRDYSALEIRNDGYLRNIRRAAAFETQYRLSRLGKPVERGEWSMTPPTVNAYYNPSLNEIVFPAGILQSPFFRVDADDAVNYGAIGAVIGHEITHGFDDQGSRFDGQGNLNNWWTAEDRARFTAKADKLVAQYDACVVVDNLHVNGKLTLGENIADLGGVAIAYAAYQKSLGGKPAPVIDGLTGSQRFFVGYARVWRGAVRDADQRVLLRTDPHSPSRVRVLVPLSNFDAFYEAFNVKPGDKMYRPANERAEIW